MCNSNKSHPKRSFLPGIPLEILQIYHKKTCKAGEYVFREGSEGDEIYIIQTGMAEFILTDRSTGLQVKKNYFPGDYFGEQIILTNELV